MKKIYRVNMTDLKVKEEPLLSIVWVFVFLSPLLPTISQRHGKLFGTW